MISETELIHLIRNARHEWLNELQVIKGYLTLNQLDNAEGIIEGLIMKSRNEAKLSNQDIPLLSALVLTFNWYQHTFKLDLEVTGEGFRLSVYDRQLASLLQNMLHVFDEHASNRTENTMALLIHIMDTSACLTLDFTGQLNYPEQIEQFVEVEKEELNQSIHLVEHYIKTNEAVITFEIN
ncbi:stage 0 sporulation protein B (sporulation initiation phosphotransferase) [Scopulibacillus darangshiensis]|uniref:Stage 0 sporulation protein B (Sporulation initiation phosphotransferase) n=1 Tax=Scopulibacillus darangshiensis TaxID=442528 RepID=A0A4R2PCS8_9BACL|nr:Spo0B C-terminal domain-containing protein [Scopulibacillus darangshiensis]TCP32248.1 stage 0 sporulation protein B (sporulation initiation phosphotransferase) [Scopulibacillus darangshiensis]